MSAFGGLIVGALAMQIGAQPCVAPAMNPASVDLWRPNIAEIERQIGSNVRGGTGLVVGWRNGEAWIAVPSHVLWGDEKPISPADYEAARKGLRVRFRPGDSPRPLCPSRPALTNPTPPDLQTDVSFVCVNWTLDPLFWSGMVSRPVAINDAVELLTPERASSFRGSVSGFQNEGINQVILSTMSGVKGRSGSPVIAASGVVGLYLGRDATSRIVSLATVRAIADRAQVPWSLEEHEFYDCRRQVRVCPELNKGTGPPSFTLTNVIDRSARVSVPSGTCRDLPEGRYHVDADTREFTCDTAVVSVRGERDLPLRVRVTCHPDLSGTWRSAEGLQLDCVASATPMLVTFRCAGLQGLGLGVFNATLQPNAGDHQVTGEFADFSGNVRPVNGVLTWTPGSLSGQLSISGLPPRKIELRRVNR